MRVGLVDQDYGFPQERRVDHRRRRRRLRVRRPPGVEGRTSARLGKALDRCVGVLTVLMMKHRGSEHNIHVKSSAE